MPTISSDCRSEARSTSAASLERAAFKTDLCDQLHRIECPVVVIHGTNDAPFTAGAQLLERGLPRVRKISLPGVGHHPLVEEHRRVTSEIGSELDAAR